MIDLVDRTLKHWRQTIFVYGDTDCLLSVGDYMHACGGVDVPSKFRGTYDTAQGALAIVAAHGGPQGLLDQFGFPRCDLPDLQRGDTVIFDTGTENGLIGGLCTGPGIAARLERGVIEVNRKFVSITYCWKIPNVSGC